MKTIASIFATTLLLASVSATAGNFEQTRSETQVTSTTATKAEAYQLGVNKLTKLRNVTSQQLEMALTTPLGNIESNSLRLNDGGYITIQERMDANGKIGYVGLVNIDFSYIEHDSDR